MALSIDDLNMINSNPPTGINSPSVEARLMAIAYNAVKEAVVAKGRDTSFTDNDSYVAMTVRRLFDNLLSAEDAYNKHLPLAQETKEEVSPVIDKVYNMLDKELSGAFEPRAEQEAKPIKAGK